MAISLYWIIFMVIYGIAVFLGFNDFSDYFRKGLKEFDYTVF